MQFISLNLISRWVRSYGDRLTVDRMLPLVTCLMLPLIVLLPLLSRGYVLHYDMIFVPHVSLNMQAIRDGSSLYQTIPITIALKLFSLLLPMDIVQKLILYFIFFTSAFTIYRLLPDYWRPARLIAGIMYALNPFTYDRLMAGHWLFLVSYSLTPLILGSFIKLFTAASPKRLCITILLWSVAAIISPHHLLILGLLFVSLCVWFVRSRRLALYAALVLLGVVATNLWWLIPTLFIPNFTTAFNTNHFFGYATRPDLNYGLLFTMLSLQGFWYGGWLSLKQIVPGASRIILLWLVLVLIGIASYPTLRPDRRKLLLSLLLAAGASLLFAAGPNPSVATVNIWLFQHVPGLSGLREPQKLLSVVALLYAVLVASGLDAVRRRLHLAVSYGAATASLILVGLLAMPLYGAAHGQLRAQAYPRSWEVLYQRLHADRLQRKVVVLPWALYNNGTFTRSLTANPASQYFGAQAITSRNSKLPGIIDTEPARYQALDQAISGKNVEHLKTAMKSLNVGYIMLMHSDEDSDYNWIFSTALGNTLINDHNLVVIALTK